MKLPAYCRQQQRRVRGCRLSEFIIVVVLLFMAAVAGCGMDSEPSAEAVGRSTSGNAVRSGEVPELDNLGVATTSPATTTTTPFGDIPLAHLVGLTDWQQGDWLSWAVRDIFAELRIEDSCLYLMEFRDRDRDGKLIEPRQFKFNFLLPKRYTGYDPATESLYSYGYDYNHGYGYGDHVFGPMRNGDIIVTTAASDYYQPDLEGSNALLLEAIRKACPADGWAESTLAKPLSALAYKPDLTDWK